MNDRRTRTGHTGVSGVLAYWMGAAGTSFALYVMGATVAADWAWGMHPYAFLPRVALVTAGIALGATCAWAIERSRRADAPRAPSASSSPLRTAGARVALFVLVTAVAWIARVRHTSLGDGGPLAESLAAGLRHHPDSPLAVAWLQAWYTLVRPWIGGTDAVEAAARSVALAAALAGGLFALVCVAIAGELHHGGRSSRATRAFWAAALFFQGYVLLFFGYVETYAWVALALAVHVWLSLRGLRGAASLLLPGAALALAAGFHLMAAWFAPAFAVVVIAHLRDPMARRRAFAEVAVLVLGAAAVLLVAQRAGFDVVDRALALVRIAFSGEGGAGIERFAGANHWQNAIQAIWLVGPVGAIAFLGGWITRPHGVAAWYAAIVGALALAAMLGVQDLRLGYARDWDLYAAPGVALALAGATLWSPRVRAHEKPRSSAGVAAGIAAIALALAAVHTVPWIALNASRARAFERLQTLPLGHGRTETAVAFWLLRDGDLGGSLQWTERALHANPANLAAWLLRADLAQRAGAYDDEARALKRATRLRPNETRHRVHLLDALRRAGEIEIARSEVRLWESEGGGESARRLGAALENDDDAWSAAVDSILANGR